MDEESGGVCRPGGSRLDRWVALPVGIGATAITVWQIGRLFRAAWLAIGSHHPAGAWADVAAAGCLLLAWHMLVLSLIHRHGSMRIFSAPAPARPAMGDGGSERVMLLIPSYREKPAGLKRTLLSAAVQTYSDLEVALLVDDPPDAGEQSAGTVVGALNLGLEQAERSRRRTLEARTAEGVAHACEEAAAWLEGQCARDTWRSTEDRDFFELILAPAARAWRMRAAFWQSPEGRSTDGATIEAEARRLVTQVSRRIRMFERKRYANLSHAPNKAMNLNTYLALIGGSFREIRRADGVHLERTAPGQGTLEIREAAFVAIIDADTLITPDYVDTLRAEMNRQGTRAGGVQVVARALPTPKGPLHSLVGAQSDWGVSCLHYGGSYFGSTFWAGQNGLLRMDALRELRYETTERGYRVACFIPETPCEDTVTTVLLLAKGWTFHDHPAALAFTLVPETVEQLRVQRERWSAGGVPALPSLWRYFAAKPADPARWLESVLRFSYVIFGAGGLGLTMLLAVNLPDSGWLAWFTLLCGLYYLIAGMDMRRVGRSFWHGPKIAAMSVLMLPVFAAGAAEKLWKSIRGEPQTFARTPREGEPTTVPLPYAAMLGAILAWAVWRLVADLRSGAQAHAIYAAAWLGLVVYSLWLAAPRRSRMASKMDSKAVIADDETTPHTPPSRGCVPSSPASPPS